MIGEASQDRERPYVLVAVDGSPESIRACEQAVALARAVGVPVRGLYVEDDDLYKWAAMGIGREIGLLPLERERPNVERLGSQLMVRARQAREALERAARSADVEWSFEVARGKVTRTVGEHATFAHTVVVGRVGWSEMQGARVGSTARALVTTTRRRLWLAARDRNGKRRIRLVLPPDASQVPNLVAITRELAETQAARVEVLGAGPAEDLRQHAAELTSPGSTEGDLPVLRVLLASLDDPTSRSARIELRSALAASRGPVVISASDPRIDEELLAEVDEPILIVGSAE